MVVELAAYRMGDLGYDLHLRLKSDTKEVIRIDAWISKEQCLELCKAFKRLARNIHYDEFKDREERRRAEK